jgi:hypothetical protein
MTRPDTYRSRYIPSVQFHDSVERNIIQPYVREKLEAFFLAQEGRDDLAGIQEIRPQDAITDMEWAGRGDVRIPFRYIYEVVMDEAKKVDGEISHLAYTLTFDPVLTPNQCKETGTHYGTMSLAGKPVLYYVRLDLPSLLREVHEQAPTTVQ